MTDSKQNTEWSTTFPATLQPWTVPVPNEPVQPMADLREEKKVPGTPKFFLHDEMIYWLKNNLRLDISVADNKYHPIYDQKYDSIITCQLRIAGETITGQTYVVKNPVASEIRDMELKIYDLRKEIEEIKQIVVALSEELLKIKPNDKDSI